MADDCAEADEAVEDQQDIPDMEVPQAPAPDAAAGNHNPPLPMVVHHSNRIAKPSAAEVSHGLIGG